MARKKGSKNTKSTEKIIEQASSDTIKSMTDRVFTEQGTVSEKKKLDEMLINKKTDNKSYVKNKLDTRIYRDVTINRGNVGGGFNSQTTQEIIKRKIIQYRELTRNPELETIIQDIVNEAIVSNSFENYCVDTQFDSSIESSKKYQIQSINKVHKIFKTILQNLNFDTEGTDIFRRWFIDGRLYIEVKVNESNSDTIGYEILDPLFLTLVVPDKDDEEIYYQYNEEEPNVLTEGMNNLFAGNYFNSNPSNRAGDNTRIIKYENVIAIFSSLFDYLLKIYVSPIEKSIKILNQLNNLEDAMILFQFIRAVPRRVFYIDTGTLSPAQREKYLNTVQKRHRENLNLSYDVTTGQIGGEDRVKYLSFYDDYWIATKEGDKTKIENLDGQSGAGWDEITVKLNYFRQKMYRSMNVPFSRFEIQEQTPDQYKVPVDQMNRQERKYQKYIADLRKKFSEMFYALLELEVTKQRLFSSIEWRLLSKRLNMVWEDDDYYSQTRKFTIIDQQVKAIAAIEPYLGKYYTKSFINKEILERNDDEITENEKQMSAERAEAKKTGIPLSTQGAEGGAPIEGGIGGMPEMGGETPPPAPLDFGGADFKASEPTVEPPAEGALPEEGEI